MTSRIMIVDDERSVANFLKELLEINGYSTEVYYESEKAISAFENQPERYDIVITDQTMPGITGVELAGRLLAIRSDTPIILCTGYSELVTEDDAYEIGIKYFMQKPVDISQLLDAVAQLTAVDSESV